MKKQLTLSIAMTILASMSSISFCRTNNQIGTPNNSINFIAKQASGAVIRTAATIATVASIILVLAIINKHSSIKNGQNPNNIPLFVIKHDFDEHSIPGTAINRKKSPINAFTGQGCKLGGNNEFQTELDRENIRKAREEYFIKDSQETNVE